MNIIAVTGTVAGSLAILASSSSVASAASQDPNLTDGRRQDSRAAAPVCTGAAVFDDLHPSGADASMHGWWVVTAGCAPGDHAVLTGRLQAKAPDGNWVYVGEPARKDVVYPGGGSNNRIPLRVTCRGAGPNTFRAEMDIDLVGYVDDPLKSYSKEFPAYPCTY